MVFEYLIGTSGERKLQMHVINKHNGVVKVYSMIQPINVVCKDKEFVTHPSNLRRKVLPRTELTDEISGISRKSGKVVK